MGDRSDAAIVTDAKALGFNTIVARGPKMLEECHKQGMQAAGLIHFASATKGFEQVISPEEMQQLSRNKGLVSPNFQYGGEPIEQGEILQEETLWCFDRPETLEFGKREVDRVIAVGYDAIAFDYVGYRDYHACFCPVSQANQNRYRQTHPKLSERDALDKCSLDSLVTFYDRLIRYAKSKKPGIVITAHIYPYFAPDPLYGNRVPLDYCGQTVSWFFQPFWSFEKVRKYATKVVHDGSKYYSSSKGAPFIGVYTMPPYEKDRKSPERLREEIRIIKASGSEGIQFAELGHILNDRALAKVVREELHDADTKAN